MTDINQIERIGDGVISDGDLLVVYDVTAQRTFSIPRSEFLRGVARDLPAMARGSVDVAVPAVAASSTSNVTVLLEGAAVGSAVSVSFDGGLPAGVTAMAHVGTAGSVTITFANVGTTASTGAAKVARIVAWALS